MEDVHLADRMQSLQNAMATLTPGRRNVILLRWIHGFTFAEIADLLGVSVRSVETQHLRAMKDLRARIGRGV